jgi:hypothetical protein
MTRRLNICIPRINESVTRQDIFRVFRDFNFGKINKVVIKGDRDSRCVFINYDSWYTNVPWVKNIYDRLMDGNDIKIIYNTPWHWRCVKSKT